MKTLVKRLLILSLIAFGLAGCQSKGNIGGELGDPSQDGGGEVVEDILSPTFKTLSFPNETSLDLEWNAPSSGVVPTSYTIAYQIGATAPANCAAGTVVTGIVGTTHTITGLYPGADYSFRICSVSGATSSTGNTSLFGTKKAHLIFSTKLNYSANLGGLSGADTICEMAAGAAGLPGSPWKAILSSSTVDAKDRIVVTNSVYNNNKTNRIVHTADPNDFWATRAVVSLAFDEYGDPSGPVWRAFSNTNENGTKRDVSSAQYCTDWTENTSNTVGFSFYLINPAFTVGGWLNQLGNAPVGTNCNTTRALTCINFQ